MQIVRLRRTLGLSLQSINLSGEIYKRLLTQSLVRPLP